MSRHRIYEPPPVRAWNQLVRGAVWSWDRILRGLRPGVAWLTRQVQKLADHVEANPEPWGRIVNVGATVMVLAFVGLLVLLVAPLTGLVPALLIIGTGSVALYGGLVWLGDRR
jgi:hypothetical protein